MRHTDTSRTRHFDLSTTFATKTCFQDKYADALYEAKGSLAIAERVLFPSSDDQLFDGAARVEYQQCRYKALNALGQIALRQAVEIGQTTNHKFLQDAEGFFVQAKALVEDELEEDAYNETLVSDLYLAEVYYSYKDDWHYREARKLLETVVYTARAISHKRAEAHAHYLLGKLTRRATRDYPVALDHFDSAMKIAEDFNDSHLSAKILFARGQLYAAQYEESKGVGTMALRQKAIDNIINSLKGFSAFGSEIKEARDALNFLNKRLHHQL